MKFSIYLNRCFLNSSSYTKFALVLLYSDGVVLVDPEYLKERKVYAHVLAAFRYGREDLDVLGLTFRKDLFLASMQVYPPVQDQQKPLTRLQERLIKKLGPNAYPFYFDVSTVLMCNSEVSKWHLSLVLLNPDMPCLCKQYRSRSVDFFRSQLIWIYTVCHSILEFVSTTWIK